MAAHVELITSAMCTIKHWMSGHESKLAGILHREALLTQDIGNCLAVGPDLFLNGDAVKHGNCVGERLVG